MEKTNEQRIQKARLVVEGFEEPTKNEILKDSPTWLSSVKCYSSEMKTQFNRLKAMIENCMH